MNKEKLSPSIICIIVLLIAFTVISSYLLIRINTLLRTYSLVGDHYELNRQYDYMLTPALIKEPGEVFDNNWLVCINLEDLRNPS